MTRSIHIQTPSLVLRAFSIGDVPKVFQLSHESGMRMWIPDQVYRSERHTAEVLENLMAQCNDQQSPAEAPCVLGVCLRVTGELIGHVGLSPLRDQVEIGYAIEEKYQRHGYGTEAVSTMTRWGHDTFGLPAILGVVARENIGSCRVLEKSGFVLDKEEAGALHGRHGLIRTYIMEFSTHKEMK